MTRFARSTLLAASVLAWVAPALAEEAPAAAAPPAGGVEERLTTLERELQTVREQLAAEKEEGDDDELGWQLQLRGLWFTLAHNHRREVFAGDDHQHGWGLGLGLSAPVWPDAGPIDLLAHLSIDYRQLGYSTVYTAPITGKKGTISYLNIAIAPVVRLDIHDVVRPFVLAGASIQVASPPTDAISYLDLGLVAGVGVDLRVHQRLSVGFEYRFTWLGTADQEDEDWGALGGYLAFNL